jgi:hypothetical protein
MRRREVIAVLGAAAWSGAIWAQPAERVHRLGALLPAAQVARSFREATVPELAKLGFVEGRNLVIDARLVPSDKMPVVAAELVRSNPDAILAVGGEAIAASIAASDTIPVVMYGADALLRDQDLPLSRSRGNATGFAILGPELDIKRLEILRDRRVTPAFDTEHRRSNARSSCRRARPEVRADIHSGGGFRRLPGGLRSFSSGRGGGSFDRQPPAVQHGRRGTCCDVACRRPANNVPLA